MSWMTRDLTLWAHFLLDECLPPIIRDSRWFMWIPFKLMFGSRAEIFFSFKDRAPFLSPDEFREVYIQAAPVFVNRETDLNQASVRAIEAAVVGKSALDVACGRGYLAKRLARERAVTAADILIDPALVAANPGVQFKEANVEALPFPDRHFDTVICTHTLEHVQHPHRALAELRRVTARRLLVVVPRQRPYRYTFDLHLHFFPAACDVFDLVGRTPGHQDLSDADGDWFYLEDQPEPRP